MTEATILVVEDERIVALDIMTRLRSLGYTVPAAVSSGEEAIQQAAALHPDLVLMDIQLEGDLDGVVAAEQIRTQYDIPVIFLTAYADEATLQRAKIAEPFGYVLKPFVAQELHGAIAMALYKHQMDRQLRESEQKYRSLVEHSSDGVVLTDEAGEVIEWNLGAEAILGLPAAEVLGRFLWDVQFQMAPTAHRTLATFERIRGMLADLYATGQAPWMHQVYDTEVQRPDGTRRVVQTKEFTIQTSRGYRAGSIIRDVTERKRAEESLRRKIDELVVLHALAVAGAEATNLDALLELAVEIIGKTLYSDHFCIGLIDETAGALRLYPTYRGSDGEPSGPSIPLGRGVAGQVAASGQPRRIPDVALEPAYLDMVPGTRSELCVPLKAGERVIGVINAESSRPDAFSEDDERLVTTVAGQLATAIEKMRLFEAERRRAQEAETLRQAGLAVTATLQQDEAIERILLELSHVVTYDSASVQLLRQDYLEVVGGCGAPDPAAVVGTRFPVPGDNPHTVVIQQRQPYILADAPADYAAFREEPHPRVRSWLGVPLIVRDQVIGMLAVDSGQPRHFTPDHARLVAAFANQVAIALDNARLFQEVQILATTDPLTGLFNRRHFFDLAEREIARARRYQRPLFALMLDIDRFKRVNDSYGHAIGDQVLRAVAERCQGNLRKTDLLGRYGGEEFTILLPEIELAGARLLAERLRTRIAQPAIHTERAPVTITASLGIGPLDEDCPDVDVLLRRADEALYVAKRAGRNRVRVWQAGVFGKNE